MNDILESRVYSLPVPVAARSKAWVCSYPLAEIAGSNSAGGIGSLCLVRVVTYQVDVSVSS